MNNRFYNRSSNISGPATDMQPVVPSDTVDLAAVVIALYIEVGGTIVLQPVNGPSRTVTVTDFSFLPLGTKRVYATGTTATGIHAMVLA